VPRALRLSLAMRRMTARKIVETGSLKSTITRGVDRCAYIDSSGFGTVRPSMSPGPLYTTDEMYVAAENVRIPNK